MQPRSLNNRARNAVQIGSREFDVEMRCLGKKRNIDTGLLVSAESMLRRNDCFPDFRLRLAG